MPRIYTSQSDPLDFCLKHFPETEEFAFDVFGHLGPGPDGRGNCFSYDDDHPDYNNLEYKCAFCGRKLRDRDAYWESGI